MDLKRFGRSSTGLAFWHYRYERPLRVGEAPFVLQQVAPVSSSMIVRRQ